MKDLAIPNENSVVMRETSTWLTIFISDRTRTTYKKAIEEFATFAELESPDDLYDVDSTTVLAWREHLIGLELSNNSVANRLSALSSLFRHLCDKQIVQTNPVQGIKRPKTPQEGVTPSIANKLVRKILDDAADRIIDAKTATAKLTAARNSAILHVLFFLGPRVSEVVALNVGDIVADGEYTVMKLTIKGGQAHRVPAPPEALAAVNEYLAMSGHTRGAMFRRIKGGNSRLTRLSIYNIFTQAAKRSTTHHFSTHSARATFATESLENGSCLSMFSLHWGMRILQRHKCMTDERRCTGIRLRCGFGMVEFNMFHNDIVNIWLSLILSDFLQIIFHYFVFTRKGLLGIHSQRRFITVDRSLHIRRSISTG